MEDAVEVEVGTAEMVAEEMVVVGVAAQAGVRLRADFLLMKVR